MNFSDKLSPEEQTILEFHWVRDWPVYATIGQELLLGSLQETDATYKSLLAAGCIQSTSEGVRWGNVRRPKCVLTKVGLDVCDRLTSHQPILNRAN